ncbi:hypothetical protein BYT27DRAFT_7249246 [Phlegmacium glaucopus]|nr:hypothetical protein BYT27DRAFT_7249246 [Phlegmacium glaucopus]
MSTTVPRWIVVDDVDPRIQYDGPSWFLYQGTPSQESQGISGPPFRSTLHGTQENASLSFTFQGTQVKVIGTNNITYNSTPLDPTWQCFIDNISVGVATVTFPENTWVICNHDSLLDGLHIITVKATVQNQTFWFDNIQYVPSATVPLDREVILVENLDPQLQYGQGQWGNSPTALPGMNMTLVSGSTLDFSFIGASLSWYGFLFSELTSGPRPASLATYSIDGQIPISFQLPTNFESYNYQQKFFETAQLPAGYHTLNVVYHGNNLIPLTIEYLIIQNWTLPSTTTSHTTPLVGTIVGGVASGLALTIFIIFGFLLLRRRQKRAAEAFSISSTPQPFNHTPLLYSSSTMLDPSLSGGISHSQSPQITDIGSIVTYGTKGHIYGSIPSRHASSDAIEHSTNLRPVSPPQKPPLATIDLLLSTSTLPSAASRPSPLPLPSQTNRESEGLAALGPQLRGDGPPDIVSMQNDGTRSQLHEDSGIWMPTSTPTTNALMDIPPLYTE